MIEYAVEINKDTQAKIAWVIDSYDEGLIPRHEMNVKVSNLIYLYLMKIESPTIFAIHKED